MTGSGCAARSFRAEWGWNMAQTCGRCGSTASDDAYFCPHCSNRLAGPNFAATAPVSPVRSSRLPFVLLTLGFLVVLGAAAGLVYMQVTQAQQATDTQIATYAAYVPPATPTPIGIVTMAGQPDPGVILFGTSFDPDTMVVSGPTTKVPMGSSVALVARFSSTATQSVWLDVRSGKTTTIHTYTMIAEGADYYGVVEQAEYLSLGTPGTYLVVMTDVGGNELARGTLTVTP
jgi:hypothetical protein